ncbi:hypothetical protein BDV26DRAFT_286230 [Aspergillus bertholletiae]|uniref:Aminoglycoside phosphotransferase domain-containing protein n=1 Tax=Aspergillus bertholletiae TaxID=1226010 RepID=A0A5N7AQV5_9EURO|nr:hypothetical protein BDV26DRAFT_286230 [Aspergillus bertholletiae]
MNYQAGSRNSALHLSQSTDIGQKANQAVDCVLQFRLQEKRGGRMGYMSFRGNVRKTFCDLIALIHSHYPCLLETIWGVPEYLLRNTVLLQKPEDLALYLGPDVPPKYGRNDTSLSELNSEGKDDLSTEDTETMREQASQAHESTESQRCTPSPEEPNLRLIYSADIGPPTIILDPHDLKDTEGLMPDKMGARLAWADTDILVKFGYGVRLAEAEALHLVSKRTIIVVPQLLSAKCEEMEGSFIGGLDHSPYLYSYGPLLGSENYQESTFWASEYILQQTIRGLKGHKIVFTHGDLHAGNMLVRLDRTVVLLDWGLARFWPEYWEFYSAMFNPQWKTSWDRMVGRFVPPYYVKYDVMKKIFGTIWY